MSSWDLEIWLTIIIGAILLGAILTWILTRLFSEKEVKCDWCGTPFSIRKRKYKSNKRKGLGNYCSDKCRRIVSLRHNGSFT